MAIRSLASALLASIFAARVYAQTVQHAWVLPQNPDFSTTFTQGEQVTLQWQENLQDTFSIYCQPCDLSDVDFWVVGGSDDEYQFKLGSINVQTETTFDWTVLLPEEDLQAQQVWSLRFVPSGTVPHGAGDGAEISSPQFQIVAAAPSSTTTTGAATSTSTPGSTSAAPDTVSPTSTRAANSNDNGLSAGASAGIGVGVALAALLIFGALAFWFIRRRRRRQQPKPMAVAELEASAQHPPPQNHVAPIGGYYNQEHKKPGHPESPAPTYASPMSEVASHLKEQAPVAHELNARVDPAELEGSAGIH